EQILLVLLTVDERRDALPSNDNSRVRVARNQLGRFDRQSGGDVVLPNGIDEVLLIKLGENLLAQGVGHLVERQSGVSLNRKRIDVHKPAQKSVHERQLFSVVWLLLRGCLGDLDT